MPLLINYDSRYMHFEMENQIFNIGKLWAMD